MLPKLPRKVNNLPTTSTRKQPPRTCQESKTPYKFPEWVSDGLASGFGKERIPEKNSEPQQELEPDDQDFQLTILRRLFENTIEVEDTSIEKSSNKWRHLLPSKPLMKSRCPSCPICHTIFACKKNLDLHAYKVHGAAKPKAEPGHDCITCGKWFYKKKQMMLHYHTTGHGPSDGVWPHYCDACHMNFPSDCELTRHKGSKGHQKKSKSKSDRESTGNEE